MNYKVIVSPIALKNIENALEYYLNNANKKVANNFLKDYQRTFKTLITNPFNQFHDINYRFVPLSKFPFIIFYIINEENKTVEINAIFHTSQNPNKINL